MIGRAAIGFPWIFNQIKHYRETGELLPDPTIFERMEAAKNHLNWAIEWKGEKTGILETRMHYTNYFKGIPNFKPFRTKLVTQDNLEDLLKTFEEIEQDFIPTLEKI
jgi:tRNA-dihydrouridine synthase B